LGSDKSASFDEVKALVLKEQKEEMARLKTRKEEKRSGLEAKKQERHLEYGLEALIALPKNLPTGEDADEIFLRKMKEAISQGHKAYKNACLLKPKLTKDKVSAKYIANFAEAFKNLKEALESCLNTQGLFEAGKAKVSFAAKATSRLADTSKTMKSIIEER
jgi:hypothetical protein